MYAEIEYGAFSFAYNCACIIAQFDADGRLVAVDFVYLINGEQIDTERNENAVTAEVYLWTDEMKSLEMKEILL